MKTIKTVKLLTIILLTASICLGMGVHKKKPAKSVIIVKCKIYTGSGYLHDLDEANNVIITMVKMNDGISRVNYELIALSIEAVKEEKSTGDVIAKFGRYKLELDLNERYIIYLSKKGYETKSFEFYTVGADPDCKYIFFADITLIKEGEADYDGEFPVAYVEYDELNNGFYVVNK